MSLYRSVFMGHFFAALKAVAEATLLEAVLGERDKTPDAIIEFCRAKSIPLLWVKTTDDVERIFKTGQYSGRTMFIAGCGILVSQPVINSCKKVVNFHPGDVFTCRGRHPLPFAITKKLPTMAITAHLIDSERIDAGPLIAQIFMPISYSTSYRANEEMLLSVLENFTLSVIKIISHSEFTPLAWYKPGSSPYNTRLASEDLCRILNSKDISKLP